MGRTFPSILAFQLNRPDRQTCYQYNSYKDVIEKAKTVAWG